MTPLEIGGIFFKKISIKGSFLFGGNLREIFRE
jgi:hypothetical protein